MFYFLLLLLIKVSIKHGVASAHAQSFWLVITVGNTLPLVITVGNTFLLLITVENTFPLVITVRNTFPLVITVGNMFLGCPIDDISDVPRFLRKKDQPLFFRTVISSGNVFSTVITNWNMFPTVFLYFLYLTFIYRR